MRRNEKEKQPEKWKKTGQCDGPEARGKERPIKADKLVRIHAPKVTRLGFKCSGRVPISQPRRSLRWNRHVHKYPLGKAWHLPLLEASRDDARLFSHRPPTTEARTVSPRRCPPDTGHWRVLLRGPLGGDRNSCIDNKICARSDRLRTLGVD